MNTFSPNHIYLVHNLLFDLSENRNKKPLKPPWQLTCLDTSKYI